MQDKKKYHIFTFQACIVPFSVLQQNISLTENEFFLQCAHIYYGGMAERFNATVLKTVVAQVTLSSNLSPSAMKYCQNLYVR